MKYRIENGTTIISTGKTGNEVRNKTGAWGISYYAKKNQYRAELTYQQKKYGIAYFENIEDAKKARFVAEMRVKDGTFLEWFANKPHKNSSKFEGFWENEFKKFKL